MQASLAEVFMRAKFHIKIQKYGCAGKVGSYRENSLKPRYLARNKPGARTFFTIDIAHYGLQDAKPLTEKRSGTWEGSLVSCF